MSEKTNLRQADTKVEVVGIVSENTLEESVRDGKKVISGDITVQTGDINFVTFRVYVNEKKNDGTDNGCYAGIETVMREYQSIASNCYKWSDQTSLLCRKRQTGACRCLLPDNVF